MRSRKQAIAIALEEAGASKYESDSRNDRNLRRTERKEAEGRMGQQEAEGSSHIGTAEPAREHASDGRDERRRAKGAWSEGGEGPRPCSRGPYARRTLRGSQTSQDRGPIQNDERSIGERPRTCAPYGARGWTCLEHGRQRPTVIHLGCSEHSPVPSGYDPSAKMPGRIGFP